MLSHTVAEDDLEVAVKHAWVIRSGRNGERDAWALQSGCSGGGWLGVPDLTPCQSREQVAQIVAQTFKAATEAAIANFAGQLWAQRGRIAVGDLMVMPIKTAEQIALGAADGFV
jgi:restriction system protein